MTYKLITEAELQQAIDALHSLLNVQSGINYLIADDSALGKFAQKTIATLRAVQEREGPKHEGWAYAPVDDETCHHFAHVGPEYVPLAYPRRFKLYTLPDPPCSTNT